MKDVYSFNEKLIIFYILFGLFIVTALAIALGIKVSYIISVVLTLTYFAGFIGLILKVQSKNNDL